MNTVPSYHQGHSYPLMSGWPCSTSAMPNPWLGQGATGVVVPRVDILETESSIVYLYDLAGADDSKINLEISSSEVALSASVRNADYSNCSYVYQERPKGTYMRLLSPPANVNVDDVKANYKNGVLEVVFQKTANKS